MKHSSKSAWCALITALVLVTGGVGCTREVTLAIDVATDLVPGPEFDSVVVDLFAEGATRVTGGEVLRSAIRPVAFSDVSAAPRGLRAVDFAGVPDGRYVVRVRLLRPPMGSGGVLADQWSSFVVRGTTRIRVSLDAACLPVQCPAPGGSPAFTECLAGRCVDPFCDPTDMTTWAEHCCDASDPASDCTGGVLFCRSAEDCTASPCTTARCEDGVCFEVARPDACAEGEYCMRDDGCVPLPSRDSDGGRPDAGISDAPPACIEALCRVPEAPCVIHAWNCLTLRCEALTPRPAGTPCGEGGICSDDGDCVPCPSAPLCDAEADTDDDGIPDRRDAETCDELDNDGDGTVDEGATFTLRYRDRDGDGIGSGEAELACSRASRWANLPGDCNDSDAEVRPGADERCNGIDDDCDGAVDQLDPDATGDAMCGLGSFCRAGLCGPREVGSWLIDASGDVVVGRTEGTRHLVVTAERIVLTGGGGTQHTTRYRTRSFEAGGSSVFEREETYPAEAEPRALSTDGARVWITRNESLCDVLGADVVASFNRRDGGCRALAMGGPIESITATAFGGVVVTLHDGVARLTWLADTESGLVVLRALDLPAGLLPVALAVRDEELVLAGVVDRTIVWGASELTGGDAERRAFFVGIVASGGPTLARVFPRDVRSASVAVDEDAIYVSLVAPDTLPLAGEPIVLSHGAGCVVTRFGAGLAPRWSTVLPAPRGDGGCSVLSHRGAVVVPGLAADEFPVGARLAGPVTYVALLDPNTGQVDGVRQMPQRNLLPSGVLPSATGIVWLHRLAAGSYSLPPHVFETSSENGALIVTSLIYGAGS